MINLFIMILQVLASYTENECNICAWPYYGTANRRGECVLGVGLQANLENTCTNWCLTEMGPSTVPPVASFDPNGSCICQSATTSGGPITYKARPRKSCESWGPSDEYIESTHAISSYFQAQIVDNFYQNQAAAKSTLGTFHAGSRAVASYSEIPDAISDMVSALGTDIAQSKLPNAVALINQNTDNRFKEMYNRDLMNDTARWYRDSLMQAKLAKLDAIPSTTDMQANFDRLNYAINSRSGGGSGGEPTDLTGVMTALSALSVQSTSNTDRILSALDSLNNGTDSTGWDLAGVEALIAEATNNTKRQTDTISAIDRRKWDKDAKSAAAIDSINARGKLTESQISQINGFGTEADALSLSGETEKQGLLAAILDFKSNISTTCSDGTITGMDVDVHAGDERLHTKMDFTIQLNSYFNDPNHQKAFALLRIFARIAGLTGAIMVAFFSSAMLLRVGSQINQRWKI